jgi:hypothetical protein
MPQPARTLFGNSTTSTSASAFTPIEAQKEDLEAAAIFQDFKSELQSWWSKNAIARKSQESRADCADFLTDKYMCKRLDPLPSSKIVSQIRKEISTVIELFASSEHLDNKFIDEVFLSKDSIAKDLDSILSSSSSASLKTNPYGKANILQSVESLNTPTAPNPSKKLAIAGGQSISSGKVNKEKEKEKNSKDAEKTKIKDQYEAYMKMKKDAETHQDNLKAKQMETHLDDIRSLLSSITQTTTTATASSTTMK